MELKLCLLRLQKLAIFATLFFVFLFSAPHASAEQPKNPLIHILIPTLETMGLPQSVKLPDTHPLMVRAASCANDVVEITNLLPEYSRTTWKPILYVFALKEGNCYANPPGSNDDGAACGVCQAHDPHKVIPGATCEKVRADRKLGLRVGLALMLQWSKECGSIGAGLSAYATGSCPKKGWTLNLVKERLKLAGIDGSLPWHPGA